MVRVEGDHLVAVVDPVGQAPDHQILIRNTDRKQILWKRKKFRNFFFFFANFSNLKIIYFTIQKNTKVNVSSSIISYYREVVLYLSRKEVSYLHRKVLSYLSTELMLYLSSVGLKH